MGQPLVEDFTIANGGTVSDGLHKPGYRLTGLIVPTMTSTTIGLAVSPDNTTWTTVKDRDATTPAAVTLGAADTGAKAIGVPEEYGRLAVALYVRLVVAAQGAARTVQGIFEREG